MPIGIYVFAVLVLCSVVRTFVSNMFETRNQATNRSAVAPQLIGHDPTRLAGQEAQDLPEESLRCTGVAQALDQNIDHLLFPVDRTPKVLMIAVDLQVHLVEVPGVADWSATALQALGVLVANLVAPTTHGLVW